MFDRAPESCVCLLVAAALLCIGGCLLTTPLNDLSAGGSSPAGSDVSSGSGGAAGGFGPSGAGGNAGAGTGGNSGGSGPTDCACTSVFEACSSGTCVCAPPTTRCDGRCADTDVDPLNCGSCGVACQSGEVCVGGLCVCPPNADRCAGQCRTRGSQRDCNIGGSPCQSCCPSCIQGEAICIDDSCRAAGPCPQGTTQCGTTNTLACVDTSNDPHNCGTCDHACAAGELCVSGACVPFAPAPFCKSCATCGAQCNELLGGQAFRCCTTTPAGDIPVCVAGAACP